MVSRGVSPWFSDNAMVLCVSDAANAEGEKGAMKFRWQRKPLGMSIDCGGRGGRGGDEGQHSEIFPNIGYNLGLWKVLKMLLRRYLTTNQKM